MEHLATQPGPGDEPNRTLSRRYPDETEAMQAAMSESRRLGAVAGRLTLELIGRPTLFAEGFITMSGFRARSAGPCDSRGRW